MKAFKVVKDPEAFQLMADETRRRVVYLLRAKERTVSQIAEELDLTPQAIYHHIRKMKEAGLVEVGREERVDHFIETYYRAAAEIFYFSHGEGGSKEHEERKVRDALEALGKIGIRVNADAKTVSKVVEISKRLERGGAKSDWSERVAELEDVDFLAKQDMMHFAKLLSITDKEFEEDVKLQRELRDLLRSRIVEVPAK